ncbi:L-type lectin-domain containing receptor kinase S.7 [Spatholobus suberectus]|nr:L-type lectin-domain containing receptor kinase S.7 [Spatholobus suberectus]
MSLLTTSTIILFLFSFSFSFLTTTLSHNTTAFAFTFTFPSFALLNITLLGDSFLRDGVVGLTRSTPVPASSSGTLLYNHPIPTLPPSSLSTTFSFSITNTTSTSTLTFFLNSSRTLSLHLRPNQTHLALHLTTTASNFTQPNPASVHLNAANPITSWLDYHAHERKLNVFLNCSSPSSKPRNPTLSADLDLSDYFRDNLYVGFSGSTQGSTDLIRVMSWSFEFDSFQKPGLNLHPHNASRSPASVAVEDIPASSNSAEGNSKRFVIGVGAVVPAFFCVVLVFLGYVSYLKWRGVRKHESFGRCCPKEFGYREVKLATKGFHASRVIGKGSFGTVYKALFESSGTIAAVKRSRQYSHEGRTEFLAELSVIAGLRHKNLVQLLGWCVEKGELLLVYEFMPNGSLDKTDVFSYGVVVLEVACGRRPIEREGQKMVNLVDWVWGLHSQGRIIEAADRRLNWEFKEGEMKRLLLLGLSCANPDSAQRPSMRRVLQILNSEGVALVVPKVKPTLTFSSGLPLSLDEIVSDAEEEFSSAQVVCEIKID